MLLAGLLGASCKKMNECSVRNVPISQRMAFVGFTADEVDTVYNTLYAQDGKFLNPLRTDTICYSHFVVQHDTLIADSVGFSSAGAATMFRDQFDFELSIPVANSKFRITELKYPPDYNYQQEERCPNGHLFYVDPSHALINGSPAERIEYAAPDFPMGAPYKPSYFIFRK